MDFIRQHMPPLNNEMGGGLGAPPHPPSNKRLASEMETHEKNTTTTTTTTTLATRPPVKKPLISPAPTGAGSHKAKRPPLPAPAQARSALPAPPPALPPPLTTHVFGRRTVDVPNVLDDASGMVDPDKMARMREICAGLMLPQTVYPDGATLAAQILEHDIRPMTGTDDPVHIASVNPVIFQTVQMLMSQFSHLAPSSSSSTAAGETLNLEVVPIATRAWEEAALSTPVEHERPCVAGSECVCVKIADFGVPMREFLLPDEAATVRATGQAFQEHKPCLVCIRDACLFAFAMSKVTNEPFSPRYNSQPHRNLVNVPGEYSFRDCIPTGDTLLYPMVMNRMGAYTVHRATGRVWLEQTGFERPAMRGGIAPQGQNPLPFRRGAPRERNSRASESSL